MKKMKKENKTENFHAKLTKTQNARFAKAVKKAPKDLRIKSKTDLFDYMLDTFCTTVGV